MKKLQIAIVEDMPEDREWLAGKLDDYFCSRHILYDLFLFADGEEFITALSGHWFDIVFMDIYMNRVNGVEAAQSLRAKDRDCKLVFLTVSEDFMREGFALNSAHYLVKPVKDEDFVQAMENCRIRRECKVPVLSVISDRLPVEIDTMDILYMDVINRTITIHTKRGMLPAGRNFNATAEYLLTDERFLLCNRGLLVNMDYIAAYDGNDFLLCTGERLPMTPRRRKELISRYHSYTFGSLGGRT